MIWPRVQTYWLWVAALAGLEVVSWLAYTGPRWENIVTVLVVGLLVFLAWKRPVWLAYVSIAELVVGSKGYLLFLTYGGKEISIRMFLFLVVMVAAMPTILRQWKNLRQNVISTPLLLFVGWLVCSLGIALLRGVSFSGIYTDVNAWLYLALLPAWWTLLRRDSSWRLRVLTIVLAGATIIGLKSWLMVLLFGQELDSIRQVYTWIRNTGVGEITYINANVFRVFFQSQIFSLLVFCSTIIMFIQEKTPRWVIWPLAMSALGVYISLSRSFWLGLGVALIVLVAWLIKRRSWGSLRRLWIIFPLGIFAWAMMVWALSWPYFNLSGGRANTVVARLQGSGSLDAATSRANQIKPLFTAIAKHPLIGSGFGTTVTYFSTDPRSRGVYTTAAFELGYLDLWLKIGFVGLMLYAVWILGLWRRTSRTPWAGMFLVSGLALVVVNLTSPYLNHPLGLGWLMLTSLFAYDPS